jgi:hypothetical protein
MIAKLPAPPALVRLGQSVAMLDAIVFPDDWSDRYHSFDAKWGRGEQVFSMRNGSGDFYFVWFAKAGAVLQGFAHESPMSPWSKERSKEKGAPRVAPGMFDGLPKTLRYAKTAAAFCAEPEEVTFCAWWTKPKGWQKGSVVLPKGGDPDGSKDLLFILDGKPKTYAKFIKEYVRPVALPHIEKIYRHTPLTKAIVRAINPEASYQVVSKEAKTIGYPT